MTEQPSLLERRLCSWCQRVLPKTKRPQTKTCGKRCRQKMSRAANRKRRPGFDGSLEPGQYRRLRRRAVAALGMLDTAGAAKRENMRRGFVQDAAAELRELIRELDAMQQLAFEERA